jgi:hypothetical protein
MRKPLLDLNLLSVNNELMIRQARLNSIELISMAAVGLTLLTAALVTQRERLFGTAIIFSPPATVNVPAPNPTAVQDSDHPVNVSRIVYQQNEVIYSIKTDGGDPINLTKMGVKSDVLRVSRDGRRLYYIEDHNLWTMLTTGSDHRRVTGNTESGHEVVNEKVLGAVGGGPVSEILAVNTDGSIVLIRLTTNPKDVSLGTDPSTRVYYYHDQTKKLQDITHFAAFDNIAHYRILGESVVYYHQNEARLVKLDLSSGSMATIADDFMGWYINEQFSMARQEVIFNASSSNTESGDSYSQIFKRDLKTGQDQVISPRGSWAEFQCLTVSPLMTYIIYCQSDLRIPVPSFTHYVALLPDRDTEVLPNYRCYSSIVWLSDSRLVCDGPEGEMKSIAQTVNLNVYDLKSRVNATLISGIDRLYTN